MEAQGFSILIENQSCYTWMTEIYLGVWNVLNAEICGFPEFGNSWDKITHLGTIWAKRESAALQTLIYNGFCFIMHFL